MHMDVQQFMVWCIVSDRVQAFFNAFTPQMHIFPTMGLGYQWNINFVRMLPLTMWHNWCVLVMVEDFSKHIELMSLMEKSSEGATYVFLDQMLS